jgi:hypothetical protein
MLHFSLPLMYRNIETESAIMLVLMLPMLPSDHFFPNIYTPHQQVSSAAW